MRLPRLETPMSRFFIVVLLQMASVAEYLMQLLIHRQIKLSVAFIFILSRIAPFLTQKRLSFSQKHFCRFAVRRINPDFSDFLLDHRLECFWFCCFLLNEK